ncbi:MAG TPA: hypothetical protein VG028_03535 [Terriglobia bacterium]|nr:hypothetical protein [Terriglobia bacterium]
MEFPLEHFRVVSYLNVERLAETARTIILMPLWDGDKWHLWLPNMEGRLVEVAVPDTIEGDYLATAPARDYDFFIPFVHLMWQRASWPEICPFISAICDDFHNMGTSVAKLKHMFDFRDKLPRGAGGRFAWTELEYLIILSRSVFDLLQETIASIWSSRVRLLEPALEARRRAVKLPKTFSRMVLRDKKELRTSDEIENEYGVPRALAQRYESAAPFFSQLRDHRDSVLHGLGTGRYVFATERGFCVDPKQRPFSSFDGWLPEYHYNENIVSLLPWIAYTILGTIDACNSLLDAFSSIIQFPPDIAPGYQVFIRGPYAEAFVRVVQVNSGASPWWG